VRLRAVRDGTSEKKSKEKSLSAKAVKNAAKLNPKRIRGEEKQRIALIKKRQAEEEALAKKAAAAEQVRSAAIWHQNSDLLHAIVIILLQNGLEDCQPQTVVEKLKETEEGKAWVTKYCLTGTKIEYFVSTAVTALLPAKYYELEFSD